jgi:WD40 repeat protein
VVELSDVSAFLELPDGKVLSGSESGSLLLWDGGLIKALINRPGGLKCHEGSIEVLLHDTQTNYVLSGGADGALRLWDYNKLMEVEAADNSITAELKPSAEVMLPAGARVRGALWNKGLWLVQDEAGTLYKVSL